jgi:hypothetical protein
LNRNPADVEKRNQIILQYVHPSSFHDFKKQLAAEEEEIIKGGQAYFFRTQFCNPDLQNMAFVIGGESDVWIEKEGKKTFCAQKETKQYALNFRCENGKLLLTSFKQDKA